MPQQEKQNMYNLQFHALIWCWKSDCVLSTGTETFDLIPYQNKTAADSVIHFNIGLLAVFKHFSCFTEAGIAINIDYNIVVQ